MKYGVKLVRKLIRENLFGMIKDYECISGMYQIWFYVHNIIDIHIHRNSLYSMQHSFILHIIMQKYFLLNCGEYDFGIIILQNLSTQDMQWNLCNTLNLSFKGHLMKILFAHCIKATILRAWITLQYLFAFVGGICILHLQQTYN